MIVRGHHLFLMIICIGILTNKTKLYEIHEFIDKNMDFFLKNS